MLSQPPDTNCPSARGTQRWNPASSLSARIVYAVLGAAVAASCVGAALLWRGADAHGAASLLALNAVVLLGFGLLARRVAASIIQPIELLAQATRRVSLGERHIEIPPSRLPDEVGVLTHCFRDMTRRLAQDQRHLEASQREVVEANEQLVTQNDQLHQANEVLEKLSITDGLTRLHNHRFFQDTLVKETKRADRTGAPLALILADIDHFKQWNDRLGHAGGDEILRRIAGVMNSLVRETDLLARYGGEEFAVLLPNTQLEGAIALAQKICASISQSTFLLNPPSEQQPVTISLGVAAYSGDRKKLFSDADRALYLAKDSGRDCVMSANPDASA